MRRALVAIGLVLLVACATHVDYHLGGTEMSPSYDWRYHWVLGLVVGAVLAWIAARVWHTALPRAIPIMLGGLFVGQGVEPLLEGIFGLGRWTYPVGAERWRIFFEFLVASAVGIALGLGLGRWRARAAGPRR